LVKLNGLDLTHEEQQSEGSQRVELAWSVPALLLDDVVEVGRLLAVGHDQQCGLHKHQRHHEDSQRGIEDAAGVEGLRQDEHPGPHHRIPDCKNTHEVAVGSPRAEADRVLEFKQVRVNYVQRNLLRRSIIHRPERQDLYFFGQALVLDSASIQPNVKIILVLFFVSEI